MDENLFRNLYCYLDDCEKSECKPSKMQVLMFLDAAEVSPAFSGPRWLANPVSWVYGVVVGRWLGSLMGYKVSYKEYYSEKGGE